MKKKNDIAIVLLLFAIIFFVGFVVKVVYPSMLSLTEVKEGFKWLQQLQQH